MEYSKIRKHRRRLKAARWFSRHFAWMKRLGQWFRRHFAWLIAALAWMGRRLRWMRFLNPFRYIKRLDW